MKKYRTRVRLQWDDSTWIEKGVTSSFQREGGYVFIVSGGWRLLSPETVHNNKQWFEEVVEHDSNLLTSLQDLKITSYTVPFDGDTIVRRFNQLIDIIIISIKESK